MVIWCACARVWHNLIKILWRSPGDRHLEGKVLSRRVGIDALGWLLSSCSHSPCMERTPASLLLRALSAISSLGDTEWKHFFLWLLKWLSFLQYLLIFRYSFSFLILFFNNIFFIYSTYRLAAVFHAPLLLSPAPCSFSVYFLMHTFSFFVGFCSFVCWDRVSLL